MNNKIINTKPGKIEFSIVGQGFPILFIHGGHSNCKDTLCYKGFDLNKYQLITPSRPGYGKTPLNNNKSPRQAADLIIELINYLTLDEVIIYGISAGGLTAIELAANYPERVKKLILASAVSMEWLNKNEKTYKTAKRMFTPNVQGIIWGIIRFLNKIFPRMIANNFYSQLSKKECNRLRNEDVREFISALNKYWSNEGFINDIDQLHQENNEKTISQIKCPTLIIHSEYDNSVPIEHAKYANRMINNSTIEILQNEWGHLFWIGMDSKESIKTTIKFIEE